MKNTLSSLAILKTFWDIRKKDYIDNFLPFITTLIHDKNYEEIKIEQICSDFTSEYGLTIPQFPMITILKRAKKRGLIRKNQKKYYPVKEKIKDNVFTKVADEQTRRYEKVKNGFISYCQSKHEIIISPEDADSSLLSVLKAHDLEILFGGDELDTILPKSKTTPTKKFLINSFIINAFITEPEIFKFIEDLAIGQILANTLSYRNFGKFQGSLRGTSLYFDTRFILRLLGTEGHARRSATIEFLKLTSQAGSKFFTFQHVYEEIMKILESGLAWLGSLQYDPTKASPVLRYFVENHFTESDVEQFIVNTSIILRHHNIAVIEAPSPDSNKSSQIDEKAFYEAIVQAYTYGDPFFNEVERESSIFKDIKSISSIYILRKGKHSYKIKDADHIFITTNSALAFASRKHEKSSNNSVETIPACMTDLFVGTLIWLESPALLGNLNEKKLIADCYAALEPNEFLIKKFLITVEKLKDSGNISSEEYYILRSSRAARNMLQEKTLGDLDNLTDLTPQEIIQEHDERVKREIYEKNKLLEANLISSNSDFQSMDTTLRKRTRQISTIVQYALLIIVSTLVITSFMDGLLYSSENITPSLSYFLIGLRVLLSLFGIIFGFNIMGASNLIKLKIEGKVYLFLGGKIRDEKLP